jgi:hypothetical protein
MHTYYPRRTGTRTKENTLENKGGSVAWLGGGGAGSGGCQRQQRQAAKKTRELKQSVQAFRDTQVSETNFLKRWNNDRKEDDEHHIQRSEASMHKRGAGQTLMNASFFLSSKSIVLQIRKMVLIKSTAE